MSARSVTILGTSSQTPTRERNHNACFVRWDHLGILFDPGEGTQRQMILAGISASMITHICITHFHGDHCLGLPGVIQRLSMDNVGRTVEVCFPASGLEYFERLRRASVYDEKTPLSLNPVERSGPVLGDDSFTLLAERLDHRIDCFGWRIQEPDGRRMVPERLARYGVEGPMIGRLQQSGRVDTGGRTVTIEDVSEHRTGQSLAYVMDTRVCDGAVSLAAQADVLIAESTFHSAEAALADAYAHMTSAQAAELATAAGVRRLVLTHFSQRYADLTPLEEEARARHGDVVMARDLMQIEVPRRV